MNKDDQPCKVCDKQTSVVFNINLEPVPICENCASLITMQQVIAQNTQQVKGVQ